MTKQNLIAAAFLKACQDHMLAANSGKSEESGPYLRAAMALEAAYPEAVRAVRQASRRQLKPN